MNPTPTDHAPGTEVPTRAIIVREIGLNAVIEIDDHVVSMGGWNDGWCYGHDTATCELNDEQWDRVYVAEPWEGTVPEWVDDHCSRFPARTQEMFR